MKKTFKYFIKLKNTLAIIAFVLIQTVSVSAQAPQKMSYQAVIRNANNELLNNANVAIKISLLENSSTGNAVYVETQKTTTNANGLASIKIGEGTIQSGSFDLIDWGNNSYFIKTQTDLTGGTNYNITGVSELMSVPYALYAKNGGQGLKGDIGLTGAKGDKGESGTNGADGLNGIQGLKGNIGLTGAKGDKGDTGLQGLQGIQGLKGDIGLPGAKGDKGESGTNGADGLNGIQGLKGNIGLTGSKGDKGDTGLQGLQGIQGSKGDKGDTGTNGVDGAQIKSYKVFSGILWQTSTSAPTVIVLENTLGANFTWTYNGVGQFMGTASAPIFNDLKFWSPSYVGASNGETLSFVPWGDNQVMGYCRVMGELSDGFLSGASIEFRVYN